VVMLAALAAIGHTFVIVVLLCLALLWLLFGAIAYWQSITVTSTGLEQRFILKDMRIDLENVQSIQFNWIKVVGPNDLRVAFFDIRGVDGQAIWLQRYGWNAAARRAIYGQLSKLANQLCPSNASPDIRALIRRMAA
jgi:hypothetical protein